MVAQLLLGKSVDRPCTLLHDASPPFRFVRRYGHNATTFTFEAGRKCSSKEGLFSFKTPASLEIFTKVQEKIQERKAHEDHEQKTSAPRPAEPGPTIDVLKKQLELERANGSDGESLNPHEMAKAGGLPQEPQYAAPKKKERPNAPKPADPGPKVAALKKQLEMGKATSSDGESPGPHKVEKASGVPQEPAYSVPKKKKERLNKCASGESNPNQKQALSPKNSNEIKNRSQKLAQESSALSQGLDEVDAPDCVDGASGLYAVAAPVGVVDDYDEEPMYAEPDEWVEESERPAKMSQLVAEMKKANFRQKVQSPMGDSEYDHFGQGWARARPLPSEMEHTYGELSIVPKGKKKTKTPNTPDSDPGYDVVSLPKAGKRK